MLTNVVLMWLLTFVPLIVTEIEEEHANGYALLGTLPLRAREIVAAKLLLFLAAIATCTAAQFAFLAVVQSPPALLAVAHSVILLTGAAGLLLGGIFYAAILSFGCARFLNTSLAVATASCVAATILFSKPAARQLLRKAAGFFLQLDGLNVVLGGLALYALLFLLSVTLFRFEPRKKYQP